MGESGVQPEQSEFQAAKTRIDSKLKDLKNELKAMHEQDVTLLRTLMNIHFTISALGGERGRRDSYGSIYTPSGAATPVSGTESPMLPFKKQFLTQPLQRMMSAPIGRGGKLGSLDSNASSIAEDEDDEPLGWSYNSTASDFGPLAFSLDMEHLETHLSSVLAPVPAAFRRLRAHPENQASPEPEPTTQSSSLAIMVCKPDEKKEFCVQHVTADEIGSLVMPVCGTRGSVGHTDFLSFVVDNSIIKDDDEDLEDDVIEEEKLESIAEVEPKVQVIETATVSFTVNSHDDAIRPLQSPTSPVSAISLHLPGKGANWNMATTNKVENGHATAFKSQSSFEQKESTHNNNITKDTKHEMVNIEREVSKPGYLNSSSSTEKKVVMGQGWRAPRPFVRKESPEPSVLRTSPDLSPKHKAFERQFNESFPTERTLSPSPPPEQPTHKRSYSGNVGRLLNKFQTQDTPAVASSVPKHRLLSSSDRSMSTQDLHSSTSPLKDSSSSIQELKSRLGGGQLSSSISNLASIAMSLPERSPSPASSTSSASESVPVPVVSPLKKTPPPLKPKTFLTRSATHEGLTEASQPVFISNTVGDNPIARKNRSFFANNEQSKAVSQMDVPLSPPATKPQFPRQGTPLKVSVSTPSRGISHFEIPLKTPDSNTNPGRQILKPTVTSVSERRSGTPPREIVLTPMNVGKDLRKVPLTKLPSSSGTEPREYEISYDSIIRQNNVQLMKTQSMDMKSGAEESKVTKTATVQLYI